MPSDRQARSAAQPRRIGVDACWCSEDDTEPKYGHADDHLLGRTSSAAKGWRNVVPCTCSVTLTEKHGVVLDKSHCPRHGKAAKS